jgi:hypothetical protein
MYLQTSATRMAVFACAKTQAACGKNRHLLFAAGLVFFVSTIAAAPSGAQIFGAQVGGAVNTAGATRLLEVNQFESSSSSSSVLPEAPSAMLQDRSLVISTPAAKRVVLPRGGPIAPIDMEHIPAGWEAQPLTVRDKMVLGERSVVSPFSMIGYMVTAGYEQAKNGQPNYGTDAGAFGQRLGATVLRDSTENVFTDMVFAPLLHQDPRYYVQGPQHNFFHRVVYAMTRPIFTRTDSGGETINGAQLLGDASASALSYTYYPKINQNFHDTAATFGGSLLGSALGDLVSEFSGQLLEALHLKNSEGHGVGHAPHLFADRFRLERCADG